MEDKHYIWVDQVTGTASLMLPCPMVGGHINLKHCPLSGLSNVETATTVGELGWKAVVQDHGASLPIVRH